MMHSLGQATLSSRGRKWLAATAALAMTALVFTGIQQASASNRQFTLLVTAQPDRSGAAPLDGSTISGPLYVFVGPRAAEERIDRVTFRVDGHLVDGMYDDESIDWYSPWDLMGGDGPHTKAFDFNKLGPGSHVVTASLRMMNHRKISLTAHFSVTNGTSPPTTTPPTSIPSTTPPTTVVPPESTSTRSYPLHTNIVATTFWVGELFNASLSDGSQVCSTYDSAWAYHWSGINNGTVPSGAAGCAGSIVGGCDGVPGANNTCSTEARTATNGYFPTKVTPKENPFYLDLPYDDLNDSTAFAQRCTTIPWANDPGYAGHCTDKSFSYMKDRWVKLIGANNNVCYGQIEDAGPSRQSLPRCQLRVRVEQCTTSAGAVQQRRCRCVTRPQRLSRFQRPGRRKRCDQLELCGFRSCTRRPMGQGRHEVRRDSVAVEAAGLLLFSAASSMLAIHATFYFHRRAPH